MCYDRLAYLLSRWLSLYQHLESKRVCHLHHVVLQSLLHLHWVVPQSLLHLHLHSRMRRVVLQSLLHLHRVVPQTLRHVHWGVFHQWDSERRATDAHAGAKHTKDIRPSAESCSFAMDATRAIARVAGQEVAIVNFQVAVAKRMTMVTLETKLLTWQARETFRSCAMEFPWKSVGECHLCGL
jgi:hypothetical protein